MATPDQRNGAGSTWLTIVGILLAIGAYLLFQRFQTPPPRPLDAPVPEAAPPTPTPPSVPTPTLTPTPTPEPPRATPVPESLPALSKLERRQWPLRVKMLKPSRFPVMINGQLAGGVDAPAGVMVTLVDIRSDDSVSVQFQQGIQTVPAASTDIYERVRALTRGASPVLPSVPAATPAPFAGFEEVKKAATAERKKRAAPSLRPGSLVQNDFDSGMSWPGLTPTDVGTIDEAEATEPSLGLKSNATISSGPLAVKSGESDLGKMTLAFSLSASAARPVVVRVESFDQANRRTGGLEATIYPAAPDFYQRYALDLSTFKPVGEGKFSAETPMVGFTFAVSVPDWKGIDAPEIRLDNVHYAKPAFYVSAKGKDQHSGRSESAAFQSPQKALNEAGPGDIILVMNGTYEPDGRGSVASFKQAGLPSAWISLKNYPGHTPTFSAVGVWDAVKIGNGSEATFALAYLEMRGLHVRGDSDEAKKKYAKLIGQADPHTNGNGISVDGRTAALKPHHIRLANNLVEYCSGGGISVIEGDWPTIENNICRNNCWWMIYAGSGISFLEGSNFDGTKNTYRRLIRNNIVSGNQCFVEWKKIGKFSDGNGIIVDTSKANEHKEFTGRTLVQSNLSYNNGGSGIHSFRSEHVDIINNTAYLNSASKDLQYGQIFAGSSADVKILNNILVAPVAGPKEKPEPVNRSGKLPDFTLGYNLYFGGNIPPDMGKSDRVHDPKFVNPSIDPATADFHLQPGSPAIGSAHLEPFMPFIDLDGRPRGNDPDRGAYQH